MTTAEDILAAAVNRLRQADDALYPSKVGANPELEVALIQAQAMVSIAASLVGLGHQIDSIQDALYRLRSDV